MWNYLNSKFVNSTKKVKIELILLPIFVTVLIYLVFENIYNIENEDDKSELYSLLHKKNSEELIKISKKIEQIAINDEVFIQKIENYKDEIRVVAKSNIDSLLIFIDDIERLNGFTNIDIFTLKKQNSDYFFDFNINLSKYYLKEDREKNIKSSFNDDKNKIEISKKEHHLSAIISNYVYIDEVWLKDGDDFLEYKIKILDKNRLLLKSKYEEIILEVHKIDSFKY